MKAPPMLLWQGFHGVNELFTSRFGLSRRDVCVTYRCVRMRFVRFSRNVM